MKAVVNDARAGQLVLGTCNGFQVLCEAGLLPGALVRNRSLRFVCDMVTTRVEVPDSPFTHGVPEGTLLHLPIAHGEGCFYADPETLRQLSESDKSSCDIRTARVAWFRKRIRTARLKTSPGFVIANATSSD